MVSRILPTLEHIRSICREVIIIVEEEEADEALEFMIQEMSTPPSWAKDLPIACEGNIGNNYGETK